MQSSEIGAVNGLRGLAFVVIFAASTGFAFAPATSMALDVVLILSGFLVAASLRREYASNGTVDIWSAIKRRLIRIVPAITVVSVVGILLDVVGVLDGAVTLRGSVAHLSTMSNLAGRANPDMLGGGTELLWPVFVTLHGGLGVVVLGTLALRRTADRGGFAPEYRALAIAGAVLAVLLWRTGVVLALGTSNPRLAIASDVHIDALFAGSLMGLSVHPRDPAIRELPERTRFLALGLAAVTALWLALAADPAFDTTIGPTLQLVVVLPIVFLALHPGSGVPKLLEHPACRLAGHMSFALFLTHLIGLQIARRITPEAPRVVVGMIGFALTIAAAHALHQTVIEPSQQLANRWRPEVSSVSRRLSRAR